MSAMYLMNCCHRNLTYNTTQPQEKTSWSNAAWKEKTPVC